MFEQIRRIGRRRAAASLLALTLAAIVAVPAVSAVEPTTPPPAGAGPLVPGRPGLERAGLLRGVVRADLTVVKRDGSTVLVHYERGEITALSETSITVEGRDGVSATFALTPDTRVREKRRPAALGDLEVGDRVMVFGTNDNGTYTAFLIRCVVKAPVSS